MRESRSYGSVRGALSNERPYRELKIQQPQLKSLSEVDSGSAGPNISCDCLSTFHARFGEIMHGL